jgi:formylglycine-generating enzyme required for sulfatase activity
MSPIRGWALAAALLAALAAGCSTQAAPLPEIVLVLDTDAPVSGQILDHPEISGDAAIDTVRVDIIDGPHVIDFRDIVASDPANWPISFGIAPQAGAPPTLRVRIRAFRGSFASPGALGSTATLEPPSEVTIDRLVELPLSLTGLVSMRIVLAEDCLGVPSSSLGGTTCVDGDNLSAPLSMGVDVLAGPPPPTVVGTWPGAVEVPCSAPAPPGRICVPGGFSILGELSFAGIADGVLLDPVPLRPVLLSPFYIDATEFTVSRLHDLAGFPATAHPAVPSPSNIAMDPGLAFCTWTPTGNDHKPVNCISWDSAKLACSMAGGALPSEAQWEHAARGRGQRRLYPWGDQTSSCCAASLSRLGVPPPDGPAVECAPGMGIEDVGSHAQSSSCGGVGDVSRDGILDLGGSVGEAMRDAAVPFTAACWSAPGIARDPVCDDPSATGQSMRGGYWNGGLGTALSPLRTTYPQLDATGVYGNAGSGFRCVYPDGP